MLFAKTPENQYLAANLAIVAEVSQTLTATLADGDMPNLVNPPTITVQLIKTSAFLFVVFNTSSPTANDSLSAIQQGIVGNFHTFEATLLESDYRRDNLWEDTCFECFISGDNRADSPYLEVNLAPWGDFNLYWFDSYRLPNQMPPRRLPVNALAYGKDINFFNQPIDCSLVFWQSASSEMLAEVRAFERAFPQQPLVNRTGMVLRIDALQRILGKNYQKFFVNPCFVHKSSNEQAVLSYWANRHVSPPDFHDKSVWQSI